MRQAKSICLILALCAVSAAALSAGEIYRWKDANGTWHYADQPVPGAERISGVKPPAPRPAATTPAAQAPAGNAPPGSIGVGGPPPALNAQTIQKVRAEVSEARAEQCKKSRAAYELAIQSRRIFRVNAKGEREYLNEAEAETSRMNARAEMDSACGPN